MQSHVQSLDAAVCTHIDLRCSLNLYNLVFSSGMLHTASLIIACLVFSLPIILAGDLFCFVVFLVVYSLLGFV